MTLWLPRATELRFSASAWGERDKDGGSRKDSLMTVKAFFLPAPRKERILVVDFNSLPFFWDMGVSCKSTRCQFTVKNTSALLRLSAGAHGGGTAAHTGPSRAKEEEPRPARGS